MKIVCGFIVLLFPLFLLAQNKETDRYQKQESELNDYQKSKKFKGPKDWGRSYPKAFDEHYNSYDDEVDEIIPTNVPEYFSKEDISESRQERYGNQYGDGVVKKPNPDIIPPNPVELPDITIPEIDVDLPTVDLPDISLGSWEFWKFVLLILVICALIFILYLMLRKIKPLDSKVKMKVDDEWNPTVVTKSELELKLEKAIMGNNYRECVRIHFMFILKELINNNFIEWKPEKTNYDYLNETRKSKGYDNFHECVRIYDLVWYGDYEITQTDYNRLKPTLESYYQSLNPINE